ncbi:hypothetical protein [Moritella sp. 28]|uniref:hypothetical protein n=1 Tax=Moritella sp. 28 TaxID=2746232 RepID=UPI001BA4E8A2|nr:hypothetical protein [Moritella sp. 28]QUM85074.1 hypothetical protein HWV02_11475 [Moritella sp. 28]
MSSKDTNLSNYGFDMMVATTQKSINANLKRYLKGLDAEAQYLCFVMDPVEQKPCLKPLDELINESGVNPFDLPDDVDYKHPDVQALYQHMFMAAIMMKPGLPDMAPSEIPDMVEIAATNSSTVQCNLLYSEFKTIDLNPGAYGISGTISIISQGVDESWSLCTSVNLAAMKVGPDLNTKYFNKRPQQKKAILDKISHFGDDTFSLEQLYLDLTNAKYQKIEGARGLSMEMLLYIQLYAQPHYDKVLKLNGEPVISLSVTDDTHKPSLNITGVQRTGLKYLDEDTLLPVNNPSKTQKDLATFNYMCVTGNHHLPAATSIDWNWISESESVQDNGVIAISRSTITEFYKNAIIPTARNSMLLPWVNVECGIFNLGDVVFDWNFRSGQKATEILTPLSGSDLLIIKYHGEASDRMTVPVVNPLLPFFKNHGALSLYSDYECRLSVSGNTVIVTQNMKFNVTIEHMADSAYGTIINRTITETHDLYVDSEGQIKVKHQSTTKNEADTTEFDISWIPYGNVTDLIKDIKKEAEALVDTRLTTIPTTTFESFVFPGGDVFSYKDVKFSEHQDLVSNINYKTVSAEQEFEVENTTSEENCHCNCHGQRGSRNIVATVD